MHYLIWPENWPALINYMELGTQWRVDPNGTRYGFDYTAVRAHLEFTLDKKLARKRYEDVLVMERAASVEHQQRANDAMEAAQKKQDQQSHSLKR